MKSRVMAAQSLDGLSEGIRVLRSFEHDIGAQVCLTEINIQVDCCVHSGPPEGVDGQTESFEATQMAC